MDITASARRRIEAPAERIYHYIADFRNHHPRILPAEFGPIEIESGGYGSGTVHRFTVSVAGREAAYRVHVREPEPGRVLTETDEVRGLVTTFTVAADGGGSLVTIHTRWQARGIRGLVERMVAPTLLRRLYERELELLADYAGARAFMRTMVPEPSFGA